MAEILIAGVRVDTEDIDLLVQYCPLATLDGAVKFDREALEVMPADDPLRPYWEYRAKMHQVALEIAERTYRDGVKIVQKLIKDNRQPTITDTIIKEGKRPQRIKQQIYHPIKE